MPGRTRQLRSYIWAGKSLGIFDRRLDTFTAELQLWPADSQRLFAPSAGGTLPFAAFS